MAQNNFSEKTRKYYEYHLEKLGQETVLMAAVWYRDLPTQHKILRDRFPYNLDRGICFVGHRHPHCMWSMISIYGIRSVEPECGYYESGFLTNCNRFVDREEAALLAWKAGQIKEKVTTLYSEDLY